MCGVFGILGEYDAGVAKAALGKLVHRGPDFCGVFERENLFFAHQRLGIIDTHARSMSTAELNSADFRKKHYEL